MNDDSCDNCGKSLEKVKNPIRVGAYAMRGSYCSPLCAHLCQPGWTSLRAAVNDAKKRMSKKVFSMKVYDSQIEAVIAILIGLKLKEIKFSRVGKNLWRVEGGKAAV